MHGQIADYLVLIDGVVQSLLRIQYAQGFDQARLILLADLCFGVIEDVAVAVTLLVSELVAAFVLKDVCCLILPNELV